MGFFGLVTALAPVGGVNPNAKGAPLYQLEAYVATLEMIRALRPAVARIRKDDASLARQARDAASSVALNLKEGHRRVGRDRKHLWRIAAGSADEVRGCLEVATAWGYLEEAQIEAPMQLCDRVLAMLFRLTR